MPHPVSKLIYDYDAPSSEMIVRRLVEIRKSHDLTQLDIAKKLSISREKVAKMEAGRSDPIFFFFNALELYGLEETLQIYGIDWRYYTSERLAVYCAYYNVSRAELAKSWGISYTNMRYYVDETKKTKILDGYKTRIDETFPDIFKDDLWDYYCIGKNALCKIQGNHAIIFTDESYRDRHRYKENSYESLAAEAQALIEKHDIIGRYK